MTIKGFTLGKFMPPHLGHKFMIDFGSLFYDEFTVIVSGKETDVIPLSQRFNWLTKHYLNTNVTVIKDVDDSPKVSLNADGVGPDWYLELWGNKLKKIVGNVDGLITGEIYGKYLAEKMNIEWNIVDRKIKNISGTLIRTNIFKYFDFLIPEAKRYYNKKIAIVGAESVGKTTLAQKLSNIFKGNFIPEYGRYVCESKNMNLLENDFNTIIKGQSVLNTLLNTKRYTFYDTEAFTTYLFGEIYLNKQLNYIKNIGIKENFDLYIVLLPTVEFVQDGTRIESNDRWEFTKKLITLLKKYNKNIVIIGTESFKKRTMESIKYVNQFFS